MSAIQDESHLDMTEARERFEASTDFTLAIEEEFALVDPETLELVNRFEDIHAACQRDDLLAEAAVGELISSEIEIRSGKSESFAEATERQRERRERLFATARELGIALAATGTHPWASYLDQQIIDTQHYRRLREELRWVAQRNNTWSLHVHMGVRGADRAVAVCDHLRGGAARAARPVGELAVPRRQGHGLAHGPDRDLHPDVPALRGPRAVRRAGTRMPTSSTSSFARIRSWRRPSSGGACAPITPSAPSSCGSATPRPAASESFALAGMIAACIAQAAIDYDDGRLGTPLRQREIEENLWRAIRHGMDGRMIDYERRAEIPTARCGRAPRRVDRAPARESLGIEVSIPEANGAQRAYRALASGASIREIFKDSVAETQRTYAPEGVSTA